MIRWLVLGTVLLAAACSGGARVTTETTGIDPAAYPGVYGAGAFNQTALPGAPMPTPWDDGDRGDGTLPHIFGR